MLRLLEKSMGSDLRLGELLGTILTALKRSLFLISCIYVCVCVSLCAHVEGVLRNQRVLDALNLELWKVVSCLLGVLGS